MAELDFASDVRLAVEKGGSGLLPWTDSLRMRASGASQVRFWGPASMMLCLGDPSAAVRYRKSSFALLSRSAVLRLVQTSLLPYENSFERPTHGTLASSSKAFA